MASRILLAVVGLAVSGSYIEAFQPRFLAGQGRTTTVVVNAEGRRGDDFQARRPLIQGFVTALGVGLVSTVIRPPPAANAEVFFDADRYGDKELKIATVNKLKQKLRNAVAADTSLAVPFLRLAVNDALGFSSETNQGGPDGSILFELDRPQNAGLKPALERLIKIKQEVQSTNEITLADIVAFAGATVIEAVGGPRISVQLGRYDAKGANDNPGTAAYAWDSLTGAGIKETFAKSGLGAREGALLFGAMGAIHMATTTKAKEVDDDEYADDFDEEQPFIPNTFGRAQDIYGAQIGNGKFDTTYLATVLKGGKTGLSQVDKAITEDSSVKAFVQKYATNTPAFTKDLIEAYQRLTTLGFVGTTRNS